MEDNEKLIEEAAKVLEDQSPMRYSRWPTWVWMRLARAALAVFEKAHTQTDGSCWDASPQIIRGGGHDPMPFLCELAAGHLGAHRAGQTEWLHSSALVSNTPTDDESEALLSTIINAPESGDALYVAEAERVRDAVLAAGFRRSGAVQ